MTAGAKLVYNNFDRIARQLPQVMDKVVRKTALDPIPGKPGLRGFETFVRAFEAGILIRVTGDIIALSPPLIITKGQIGELIDHVREVLRMVD